MMPIQGQFLKDSTEAVKLCELQDMKGTKSGQIQDLYAANTVVCNLGQFVAEFWTVTVPANFTVIGEYLARKSNNYYEPVVALNSGDGTTTRKYMCFCPRYGSSKTTDAGVSIGAYEMHVVGFVNT